MAGKSRNRQPAGQSRTPAPYDPGTVSSGTQLTTTQILGGMLAAVLLLIAGYYFLQNPEATPGTPITPTTTATASATTITPTATPQPAGALAVTLTPNPAPTTQPRTEEARITPTAESTSTAIAEAPPPDEDTSQVGRLSFIRSSNDGRKQDIYVVNADGTNQQQATHDILVNGAARWSPDGHSLVFQATIDRTSQIMRVDIDEDNAASAPILLTADIPADSVLPAWSPDGKMIAFQSKRDGDTYQVFVMDSDGGNKRRISDVTGNARQPAWSPDGKLLAFAASTDPANAAPTELYVASVDGTPARAITSLGSMLSTPIWSGDGSRIVFRQALSQRDYKLLVSAPDGTNIRTIFREGLIDNLQLSSGRELAYHNLSQEGGSDIVRIDTVTGRRTLVTPGAGEDYMPTWSPNGAYMAWSTDYGGGLRKIVIANKDGSNRRVVSRGSGVDYQPAWALYQPAP
jgi:Tol biopolymer transport system component